MNASPDNVHPRSWVSAANEDESSFPLSSLPYCALLAADETTRLGIGIGDAVLDLRAAAEGKLIAETDAALQAACAAPNLNPLMECGSTAWSKLRAELSELLHESADGVLQQAVLQHLRPMQDVRFALPVQVTDYTDFYASREHATNVGKLFRPDQPLLPNYDWIPIGYHGRASSVIVSGTDVRRPRGQQRVGDSAEPVFELSWQLDYEVELAAYVGTPSELGVPVSIERANEHIFGYSLLNDWSARDIQSWEYQPLGPFLGKSFATSVSPWVVPASALEPYRMQTRARAEDQPQPLAYLAALPASRDALDVQVEVWLTTAAMRAANGAAVRVSQANAKNLYWSFAQMLTHHTSNGCNLRVGNLLASGTISGRANGSEGCLLERTRRGSEPLILPNGETRAFLEDGDEVILRAFCEREGFPRISFGECRGTVLPVL